MIISAALESDLRADGCEAPPSVKVFAAFCHQSAVSQLAYIKAAKPGPIEHYASEAVTHISTSFTRLSQLCLQLNHNTKRMEYDGAVLNMVMAMAELAHGGQILMDEASFDPVKSGLVQLRSHVAAGPDLDALHLQCRYT